MIATTIEQSKKLIELGIDVNSADMYYWNNRELKIGSSKAMDIEFDTPAWSLSALLNILLSPHLEQYDNDTWVCSVFNENNHFIDDSYGIEPVDVCYEMILKLHDQKLL